MGTEEQIAKFEEYLRIECVKLDNIRKSGKTPKPSDYRDHDRWKRELEAARHDM